MPIVDLSRIGLEGIDSAHRVFASQAATAASNQSTLASQQKAQQEAEDREKMDRLSNEAVASIDGILKGKRPSVSGDPDDEIGSLAEPLEVFGDVFIRGGAPVQGMEFLSQASQIRKREDDMKTAELTRREKDLDNMKKAADLVSRTVGTAATEGEWNQGWQAVRESGLVPDNILEMFEGMGYSPDAVALVNEQALSAKDRADLDRLAVTAQRQQQDSESLRSYRERMLRISQGRLDEQKKAAERVGREGKSATAPSPADIASVTGALINQVFDGKDPGKYDPGIMAGSAAVASRAKQMVTDNKALDWDTAVQRAIEESKAAGDWEPWVDIKKFAGIETSRTPIAPKFKPQGKTEKTAMPLPMSANGVDTSKLVKGRYYIINGEAKQFTGE